MSIDWSKAPEGATHWEPTGPEFHEGWMKKELGKWFWWSKGSKEWVFTSNVTAKRETTFEARPQETWDGQGLPPVGTVCEYRCNDSCEPNDWTAVHVLAHAAHGSDTAMLLAEDNNGEPGTMYGRIWVPGTCRPLRTPEQIAAEERRNSILHLANILIDSRGQCNEYSQAEAIFDAGYRRQEEGK